MTRAMSFRSAEVLADWLTEFEGLEHPAPIAARVIEQDGSQGANTGLVAARLSAGFAVYIQPQPASSEHWVVTFEAREDVAEADPREVARLSAELATVAALCAFLEAKSREAGAT